MMFQPVDIFYILTLYQDDLAMISGQGSTRTKDETSGRPFLMIVPLLSNPHSLVMKPTSAALR
jgi:hypothetical protein